MPTAGRKWNICFDTCPIGSRAMVAHGHARIHPHPGGVVDGMAKMEGCKDVVLAMW